MTHASLAVLIAALLVSIEGPSSMLARAQNLDAAQQALQLISNTANEICQSAPLEQTNQGFDLSGEASAKVGGLVGKLADLGVSGIAKYQSGASKGVLQKDLVAAIQSTNGCKLQVFTTLEAKLLASPAAAARSPVSVAPAPLLPAPLSPTLGCTVADPTGTPLNIRDRPNGAIVGSLPNGFPVKVARSAARQGTIWIEIANTGADRPTGWVYRPYIQCPVSCTVADPSGTPLNIRDGPNGAIIGSLPKGFPVEIAHSAIQHGTIWVEIASAGADQPTGWVYGPYLECSAN